LNAVLKPEQYRFGKKKLGEHNGSDGKLFRKRMQLVKFKFKLTAFNDWNLRTEIKYDGVILISIKRDYRFPITALKEFKVVKTEIQEGDNQTVSINFFGTLRKTRF
jgi:hypothetical protein